MIIRTLLEALAIAVVIIGMVNEKKLISFEDRIIKAVVTAVKRRGVKR